MPTTKSLVSPTSNLFTSAPLAAGGDFTAMTPTTPFYVKGYRFATVAVSYVPGAVNGYPDIMPLGALAALADADGAQPTAPGLLADLWYQLPALDGSVTVGSVDAGTPAGIDLDGDNLAQGRMVVTGLIGSMPAIAAAKKVRQFYVFALNGVSWFQCNFAEKGVTATPGTLAALVSFST